MRILMIFQNFSKFIQANMQNVCTDSRLLIHTVCVLLLVCLCYWTVHCKEKRFFDGFQKGFLLVLRREPLNGFSTEPL